MKLIFDKETHTYFDEEQNKLPSISEIIRSWLGDKYASIDPVVLKKSQDKGNIAHEEVEGLAVKNIEPKNPSYEFKCFKKLIKKHPVTATRSEEMVYGATEYGAYAGTYDLFDSVNGILYDIKTNYSLNKEYVQIQLSLYAMALRQNDVKVTQAYVIHLPPEKSPEKPQILGIDLLSDEQCENIVRAYFAGESKPQEHLQCLNETAVMELGNAVLMLENAETVIKGYKDLILQEMETRQLKQIKLGNITISYIPPTVRESIDTARLKKEQPQIAADYKKISNVKSSVRITSKGV